MIRYKDEQHYPNTGVREAGSAPAFALQEAASIAAVKSVEIGAMARVVLRVFSNRQIGACNVPWDDMDPTEVKGVRGCTMCARNVHSVENESDFDAAALLGRCVSLKIDPDDERFPIPEDWDGVCGVAYPPTSPRPEDWLEEEAD